MNNKKPIQEHFFIIDSDNLDKTDSKLYGYSIADYEIITNENYNNQELDYSGSYINITREENTIRISQDYVGCYGLYIYENEDYFAVSNSFFKLLQHVNDRDITLNRVYADSFIFTGLCSLNYDQTLINEIRQLPRNTELVINTDTKELSENIINFEEHSLDINSIEAVQTLDAWYEKWVKLTRKLVEKNENIYFELSGGFDSRTVATIWLNANINLKNMNIVSNKGELFREDYKIAQKIADYYSFTLNNGLSVKKIPFDNPDTIIDLSFYTKLGFHNQMYYQTGYYQKPLFSFNGGGGECIRPVYNQTPDEFIETISYRINNQNSHLSKAAEEILEENFNKIRKSNTHLSPDSKELAEILYKESRNSYHFGKTNIERFISNNYSLTPLHDPLLHRIKRSDENCKDKYLLMALIITRYAPELIDIEIEGNREFKEDTLKYAQTINSKYPYKKLTGDLLSVKSNKSKKNNDFKKEHILEYENKIEQTVLSEKFEDEIEELFSKEVYSHIIENHYTPDYNKLYISNASLAVVLANKYVNEHLIINPSKVLDEYINDNSRHIDSLLLKYATSSVELKIPLDSDNDLEIASISDENALVTQPRYFSNKDFKGYKIESNTGKYELDIRSTGNEELQIELKGVHYTINNSDFNQGFELVPINVDYRKFNVNNENVIDGSKVVNYELPFVYSTKISEDITHISLEWLPINQKSYYKLEFPKIPTKVYLDELGSFDYNDDVVLTGKLVDEEDNVLPNSIIILLINNGKVTIRTDDEGYFRYEMKANHVGTNSVTAIFPSNNKYDLSNDFINFNVNPVKTHIEFEKTENVQLGGKAKVIGRLLDENDIPINANSIRLLVNNGRATVSCDEEGFFEYELNATRVGTNNITAIFTGSTKYELSTGNIIFDVLPYNTEVLLDEVKDVKLGEVNVISGRVVDDSDGFVAKAVVKFIINNGRASVRCDDEGYFRYEYKTTRTGRINVVAMYLGNKKYTPSNVSSSFMVD